MSGQAHMHAKTERCIVRVTYRQTEGAAYRQREQDTESNNDADKEAQTEGEIPRQTGRQAVMNVDAI